MLVMLLETSVVPVSTIGIMSVYLTAVSEARTTLTVPSQDEETKASFLTFDQSTEKTSRVCSCQARIGRS